MKILVLLKQTPDTEAKIQISANGKEIESSGVKYIVNPYDEFAIEEALLIKKKLGSGEVVIASFGSSDVKERILRGLAMGADRGLLISNEGLEQCDGLTVAKVLSACIKQEEPQIVLCGKQGIDDDNMHVGTMTAELLSWPHVNVVTKLEVNGDTAKVEREIEGGQVEVYDVKLPAVFGAHKALNTPRYASLPGIMKAKRKPFDQKTPGDIGVDVGQLKSENATVVDSYSLPPEKPAGKLFKDEPVEEMVSKVVKLLREEAKVL
ncbi:MAG: electron transfer flavoprotein subunit beta/FixA family protein [Oligoflexales bacterium]|nr:electron transfer flavoprotein subunit beta/FixA family protein [Oligoflexales bacterium]